MGGQVLELKVDRLIEAKRQAIEQSIKLGIELGIRLGIELERESSIRIIVQILHQQGLPRNEISDLLCAHCQISAEEAENYIAQYW